MAPTRALRFGAVCGALFAAIMLLASCSPSQPPAEQVAPADVAASTADVVLPSDDVVDLTLYFRTGTGEQAHLVPVTRTVTISDDLPRRALELLLAGPSPDDEAAMTAPLPTTTRVRSFSVAKGLATVELSTHVITDADTVGASPTNELLALGAIANTLTEFPQIEAVRVLVEDASVDADESVDGAAFWGGWGLPERLVRDDSIIGASGDGDGVLDLDRFRHDRHEAGSPGGPAVQVRGLRVRDRTTYIRVIVELADGADPDVAATVPPSAAWIEGDDVVLVVREVAEYTADVNVGQRLEIGDPAFEALMVERADEANAIRIRVDASGPPQFWLHSLSSPTRVVLDIRKHAATP